MISNWSVHTFIDAMRGRPAAVAGPGDRTASIARAATADRDESPNPERLAIEQAGVERIRGALDALPAPLREVVVLREQEELSYKEIASIAGIPIGTVMSRLARARSRLLRTLSTGKEG